MAYDQYSQYQAPSRPYYNQQAPRGAPAPRGPPRGPPRGQQQQYADQNGGYGQERQQYQQGAHESYQGYDDDGFWDQYGGEGDMQGYGQQYSQNDYQGYNGPRQRQPQQYPREQMHNNQDYPPRGRGYGNGMSGPPGRGRGRGGPAQNYGPPRGGRPDYDNRPPMSPHRGTPPRQMQGKSQGILNTRDHSLSPSPGRPRLIAQNSPEAMSFDNPFPVFPTNTSAPTARSDEEIASRAMAGLDINARPSLDSKRPPTSGSSGSYNSSRANYANGDPRGERAPRNSDDRYGPRPFENRGPPLRVMTMPEDNRAYPGNDRRAHADPNSWQDSSYDVVGSRSGQRDPIPKRSFTSFGDRPGPMQAPERPSTASSMRPHANGYAPQPMNDFQPRMAPRQNKEGFFGGTPGQPQRPPFRSKESALEAYMPDFDAQEDTRPLRDAIGIPLDAAPEAVSALRSATPTRAPMDPFYQQVQKTRSQPDLRGQANGYGQGGAPAVPQIPPHASGAYNGQRRSPPQPLNTNIAPAYANTNGQGSLPNSPRHFHRPGVPPMMRNETAQSGWSDPGPQDRSGSTPARPNGLPDRAAIKPPPSVNPDALPSNPLPVDTLPPHPAPVRAGLLQNGGGPQPRQQHEVSGPAQIRQVQAHRQSMSDTPRPSTADKRVSAPVTYDELFRLREAVKKNPSDQAAHLFLVKRLVEAANVLSNEDGRADARTTQKNREKFIFEAHKNVKKLVSANYTDAMFYLADCYGTGQLGLAVDAKEAFGLYQAAAKIGHPPSAYRTAVCCEMGQEAGGGTRKDPLKAVQWYRRAAALGDVPAMYKLGMILLKGLLGQQQSLGEAMIWLQRAADRADEENPHALHELATIYENAPPGGKVIRDEGYALQLYKKASRMGYRQSQSRLGKAFEYGQLGCPIDNRSSIHWYSKAAAQEDHEAELALSGWYLTGSPDILKQSDSEAYLWARKAAVAEMPKAEFAMGYFSETGIGCPKSLEDAKRWYGRAASKLKHVLEPVGLHANEVFFAAHKYPKAQERLEELKRGGSKGLKNRERHSRSNGNKNEDCVVM
jgi:TPR repeat protein